MIRILILYTPIRSCPEKPQISGLLGAAAYITGRGSKRAVRVITPHTKYAAVKIMS